MLLRTMNKMSSTIIDWIRYRYETLEEIGHMRYCACSSFEANFRPQNILFPQIFRMLLPQTFRVVRGGDVARENRVTQ